MKIIKIPKCFYSFEFFNTKNCLQFLRKLRGIVWKATLTFLSRILSKKLKETVNRNFLNLTKNREKFLP